MSKLATNTTVNAAASPHRLVMASAGTGKTFRLTGEYLRHALREVDRERAGQQADLASILATTFTRKAAGEILDRLLDRLSGAAVDPDQLADLRREVDASLTPERCSALLAAVLRNLERLSVETIDAYFMRIAKLFALELGVPPGWRIAEAQEDEDLREESLDAVFEQGDRDELLAQLAMLMRGELGRSVRRSVLNAVNGVYEAYQLGDGREEIWRAFGPQTKPLAKECLDDAIKALESVPMPLTKAGHPNKVWVKANDAAMLAVRQEEWEDFIGSGIAAKLVDTESEEPKFSGAVIEPAVESAYRPLIDHANAVLLTQFRDQNLAIHHFAKRFDEVYWGLKSTRGLYRFEDVPRVLLDASLQEKLNEVYFRMDATIRHVLLDEFQDTSLVQFQLLEPLLDEVLSADDGRSVFCVGDIKQSLYSWRGAEPGLMPAMPERWSSLVQETLEKSYRSSAVIMETVNAVFDGLRSNAALVERTAIAKEWSKGFKKHTTAKMLSGASRLVVAPVDAEGEPQAMAFAAERVKAIMDASRGTTVGVLVRTNKHIPTLIYELKRLGIEASEEGGSPLMDTAPVAVAVSLLQLADFPGDSAAAFHVATSPLGKALSLTTPLVDARVRQVSALIRGRLMTDGYAAVLRWALEVCAAQMDERGFARFNQLIDLAQQFEDRAGSRPADFVRLVRDQCVEDPSRNRVRVMSIHKSKGLEFDAVVLPDLDKKWGLKNDGFLTDRDGPFGPVTAATKYPNEQLRAMHPGLSAIYERNMDKAVREELSCLYVAMTRAAHSLEMIVLPSDEAEPPLSAAGVLRAALSPDTPASPGEELWRSTPYQSWEAEAAAAADVVEVLTPVELVLQPGSDSSLARRHRASPSSLEPKALRLDSLFSVYGERARDEGNVLHGWFELVEWLDDRVPTDPELLAAAGKLGWEPKSAEPLIGTFREVLAGDLAKILHKARYEDHPRVDRIEVRREWAFEVRLPTSTGHEAVDLAGRFDRLVLGYCGGKVVWADVLDFKSDDIQPGDAESLDQSIANYRPQMAAYVKAVCEMFSLNPNDVSASLLFIRPGLTRGAVSPS